MKRITSIDFFYKDTETKELDVGKSYLVFSQRSGKLFSRRIEEHTNMNKITLLLKLGALGKE